MSRCRRLSFPPVVMVFVVSMFLYSCDSQGQPDEDFQKEIETLREKTVPPNAETVGQSGPARSDWSVTASWDIEANMAPADYSKWVATRLEPEFKLVKAEESHLTFSKHERGDTHSVECKLVMAKDKLRIRVLFIASPD